MGEGNEKACIQAGMACPRQQLLRVLVGCRRQQGRAGQGVVVQPGRASAATHAPTRASTRRQSDRRLQQRIQQRY